MESTANTPKSNAPSSKPSKLVLVTSGLAVIALLVAGWMLWRNMDDTAESETPSAAVTITNDGFSPATIRIKKGQDVTWTNSGEQPHGVTGDYSEGDGPQTPEDLAAGNSYSYVFDQTGTYTYRDSTNGSHTGTVVVE